MRLYYIIFLLTVVIITTNDEGRVLKKYVQVSESTKTVKFKVLRVQKR